MLSSGSPNNAAVPLEGPVSADGAARPKEFANSDDRAAAVVRPNSGTSSSLALTNIPSSSIALKPSDASRSGDATEVRQSIVEGPHFSSRVESVREIACQVDPANPLGWMTFTFAGGAIVALEVPERYRFHAIDCKDHLMSHLQSGRVNHDTVSILTARLAEIPDIQFRYPAYQPAGELFVALYDALWLEWQLRPQLFPGCVLGHEGLGNVKFSHSEHLAQRLCGGEAVYFVARGCDAHEIVAVQVQNDGAEEYRLTAFTGLGGVVSSRLVESTSPLSDLSLVIDLLTKVSHGVGHESTIPLSAVVPDDWRMDGRWSEALGHAGRFLTLWKALQEDCSPNVLDTPALVAHGDVRRQSRGRVSVLLAAAPEELDSKKRIAIITAPFGVDEVLYSSGDENLVGRLSWKQLWVRAIDYDTNPLNSPKHVAALLRRVSAPEVIARDALSRSELDPSSAGIFKTLRDTANRLLNRISRKPSTQPAELDLTTAA